MEIVKGVVLLEVSKLNDLVMTKHSFLQKNTLQKGNWVYLYIRHLLSHRQTKKETVYSFNDIEGPGLHIIQYYNI